MEGAHKLPAADAANGVVLSSDGRTVSGAKVECKDCTTPAQKHTHAALLAESSPHRAPLPRCAVDKTLALARQALQHTQNTYLAAEAEYFLGRVHHSNGEFAKAEHHYQKSIRAYGHDPQSKKQGALFPLPVFGMAQLHLRSGRLAQAQTLLEQLRKHDSSSADVAHLLAYVYSKHAKVRAARRCPVPCAHPSNTPLRAPAASTNIAPRIFSDASWSRKGAIPRSWSSRPSCSTCVAHRRAGARGPLCPYPPSLEASGTE